jgi:predicted transcriptional regulator
MKRTEKPDTKKVANEHNHSARDIFRFSSVSWITMHKRKSIFKKEALDRPLFIFSLIFFYPLTLPGETYILLHNIIWAISLILVFGLVNTVNNPKLERKSPEEIVRAIFYNTSTTPKSINKIAKESELQWNTAEKYIKLIELIQSLPLKIIKTEGGATYVSRLSAEELTFDQKITIYKRLYSPKLTESEQILTLLLSKPEGETLKETPEVNRLVEIGRIKKEDNKYLLTRDGEIIARGLQKMFSEEI